ncbi:phosphocholine cytidylyltransferase family protein [Sphingomonas koreensis]|nr:phosphocholine cytidylyltransferase family protein [Sphingomonas koreensis]
MKGIILSAGSGSRLLPLTARMPKCLVEVGGKAILDHQLQALADAGIGEAVIVTGYRGEQIEEHLAEQRLPLATRTVVNPFWAVSSSIGSVWAARGALDESFCLINGDTIFSPAIVRLAIDQAAPGINLVIEPIAATELDDMRVAVADNRVIAVSKQLPIEQTTHRSLGVIVSIGDARGYIDALDAVIAEPGGTNAYHHDVIDRLARRGGVTPIIDTIGGWQEIDRPEDIAVWYAADRPAPA